MRYPQDGSLGFGGAGLSTDKQHLLTSFSACLHQLLSKCSKLNRIFDVNLLVACEVHFINLLGDEKVKSVVAHIASGLCRAGASQSS